MIATKWNLRFSLCQNVENGYGNFAGAGRDNRFWWLSRRKMRIGWTRISDRRSCSTCKIGLRASGNTGLYRQMPRSPRYGCYCAPQKDHIFAVDGGGIMLHAQGPARCSSHFRNEVIPFRCRPGRTFRSTKVVHNVTIDGMKSTFLLRSLTASRRFEMRKRQLAEGHCHRSNHYQFSSTILPKILGRFRSNSSSSGSSRVGRTNGFDEICSRAVKPPGD